MDKVIISNPAKLENVKARIAADGPERLQVLADFDRTLSLHDANGEKAPTMIGVLRRERILSENGYPEKAQALYDHYRPIEVDPVIPRAVKAEKMAEWFRRHYELLIENGLTIDQLKQVALSPKLVMRPGAERFFESLRKVSVPIVILSASGTGRDVIRWVLERERMLSENVHVISNSFVWDKQNRMSGVEGPIIHSLNKDYSYIRQLPNEKDLRERKNVLLLGDNIEDVAMTDGLDPINIIKIGFLNVKADGTKADYKVMPDGQVIADEASRVLVEAYQKAYDVIILNDGPMDFINSLLEDLIIKVPAKAGGTLG